MIISADECLRKLISKIENCLECYEEFENYSKEDRIRIRHWYNKGPWFFPPYENGVKGFFGTGKVVFVCARPSTGTFPSKAVEKFYDCIKEYGLKDAHITDLIKCRLKTKTENKKDAKKRFNCYAGKCFKHLLEELEILKPNLIVAVSKNVFEYLKNHLPEPYENRLYKEPIIHYYHASRYGKEEKLEKHFKSLKEWISQYDFKHTTSIHTHS